MHDCERTEAAGVRCHPRLPPTTPAPPTTTPAPKAPIADTHRTMEVRLAGGRNNQEGTQVPTGCSIMLECLSSLSSPKVGLRYAWEAVQTGAPSAGMGGGLGKPW